MSRRAPPARPRWPTCGSRSRRSTDADVPEPSPLFWSQLNARVRGAIDDARQERAAGWWALAAVGRRRADGRHGDDRRGAHELRSDACRRRPAPPPANPSAELLAERAATAGEPADGDGALELMLDLAATLPDSEWDTFGMAALPDLGVAAQSLSRR